MRRCWGTTPVTHAEEATGVEGTGGVGGMAAAPVGSGGRTWPGFETTRQATPRTASAAGVEGAGGTEGRKRAWLRCPWAAAGPGRASRRRAERSSQRGRLAGGPPPTGTTSSPARQHTTRRHKQQHRSGTAQRRGAGRQARAPRCSIRRNSEVLASRLAQLTQLVDRGDPAAALALGGEQVDAADREHVATRGADAHGVHALGLGGR